MVGSILFVLTFSKSANYFGIILGILWEIFGKSLGNYFDMEGIDLFVKIMVIRLNDSNKEKNRSLEARADSFSLLKKNLKFFVLT